MTDSEPEDIDIPIADDEDEDENEGVSGTGSDQELGDDSENAAGDSCSSEENSSDENEGDDLEFWNGLQHHTDDAITLASAKQSEFEIFHFTNLPLELQEAIMGYLERDTNKKFLSVLCRVNREFNARFTPALYRKISFINQVQTFHKAPCNSLSTDLLATLVSKENDKASLIRSVSLIDDLRNCGAKVDPGIVAVICSLFRKDQLRDLRLNLGGTVLFDTDLRLSFKSMAASEILLSQTKLERLEWNMYENGLGGFHDSDVRHQFQLDAITKSERPDLVSINIYNFHEEIHFDGIRALLITAVNLRELAFGIEDWEWDIFSPNEYFYSEMFEGDLTMEDYITDDEDAIDGTEINEEESRKASVTYRLFRFINLACGFSGNLTSLKLEKARFDRHTLTPKLVCSSFAMGSLKKLVLLDCLGLPLFLQVLDPPEMRLNTLHLEYHIEDSESVEHFLDNLPAGKSLVNLALMQWGGSMILPTSDGSWPDIHALYLRSLVLDARAKIPEVVEYNGTVNPLDQDVSDRESVPLENSNNVTALKEIFKKMVKLEELGIPCDLEKLKRKTMEYFDDFFKGQPWRPKFHHFFDRDEPVTNSGNSGSGLDCLDWLQGDGSVEMLPRLRTFQVRNVRELEFNEKKDVFVHVSQLAIDRENRLQADAEYLHVIFPQVSHFIMGCRRPTQFFHESAKSFDESSLEVLEDAHWKTRAPMPPDSLKERASVIADNEGRRWVEAIYPSLYMTVRGNNPHVPGRDGRYGVDVGPVLPVRGYDPWNTSEVQVGPEIVKECHLLPTSWEELDSKVYEAAWSRSTAFNIRRG